MEAKTIMKKFIVEKGLWEEFARYYTEIKLEGLYVKKEKLPIVVYTPRMSKEERENRYNRIVEGRKKGLSWRKIGDTEGISYEQARNIFKSYTE